MTDADIGSLILAISKNGDLKKSLLMSKGDAQNCFYNKLELPHNDRECNRLGSLKGSTTTRVEHISVVSKPTDPELKIIYTQHENNNSDRPVGHWFISVCDTKNNQHHDIDSRNLNTQKDSISCGLHTVLNFILAKQELLKIASEPNGRDLSLARICNRIEKKLRDFNELFGIDQFYEANIPNKQVDFNDLGLGELLASVIISFNSESEVAAKLQAELADSEYAAKLQAEFNNEDYV